MKNLKKCISLLLAFCMCLGMSFYSVKAADAKYAITITDDLSELAENQMTVKTVRGGDELSFYLVISRAAFRGVHVNLSYDTTGLTFQEAEPYQGFGLITDDAGNGLSDTGSLHFAVVSAQGIVGAAGANTCIANLRFKVADTAQYGTNYTLRVEGFVTDDEDIEAENGVKADAVNDSVRLGTQVKLRNYTGTAENRAVVEFSNGAVGSTDSRESETIEIGSDGKFTVTCNLACAVAYTTNGETYTEVYAKATDSAGTFTFTVSPDTSMEIAVVHSGDVNLDGAVDIEDAAALERHIANVEANNGSGLSELQQIAANTKWNDATLDISDAAKLEQHIANVEADNGPTILWREQEV